MNDDVDYLVHAPNFLAGFRGRELAAVAAALAVARGADRLHLEPQAEPHAGVDVDVTRAMQKRARKLLRKARALWRAMQRRGRRRSAENR